MKVIVRRKPIEAATHYDILFAVQKMQEYSGSTNIVTSVLDLYFSCMLKNNEPLASLGVLNIGTTFFNLCKLHYVQNYVSTNPQTEFYIPQEMWDKYGDGLDDKDIEILKEYGCIDYEERARVLSLDKTDTPGKIRVYKINNLTLSLQIKFAEKIYDRSNFVNVEYSQQIANQRR